jgi:hypothetical protein
LGNSSAILVPGISTPIVCTVNPLHSNKEEEEEEVVLTLEDDDDDNDKTEESKTPPHKKEEPDKTPTTKGETDALKLPETTGDNRGNAVEKCEEEDAREAPETTTTTTEETQGKDTQLVLAAILGRSHKH